MNNLSRSLKKFMGNKNTVTIIGVVLCIFILYFGYMQRINQAVTTVSVPYANTQLNPQTKITSDMISYMKVPVSFLQGEYFSNVSDIVGKYVNYSTIIAKGSLFYKSLILETLPNSMYENVPVGYVLANYHVDFDATYANSMMPESYINIYFKATTDDGLIIFGKFLENIKVIAVKDANGQNVFESSEEVRTPAYMFFALPREEFSLLKKTLYVNDNDIELTLVPITEELTETDVINVTSEDIKNFVLDKTKEIDVDLTDVNIDLTPTNDVNNTEE